MSMFLKHGANRLVALSRPGNAFLIGVAGLAAYFTWPWILDPSRSALPSPVPPALLIVLFLWPWMVGAPASGRSLGANLFAGCGPVPLPALPIGARSRAVAEAAAGMLAVMLVRTVVWWLARMVPGLNMLAGEHETTLASFATTTALGAAAIFPAVLAWTAGARQAWKPFVAVVLLAAASLGNVLATPAGALGTGLLLSAMALLRFEPRLPQLPGGGLGTQRLGSRPADRPPEARLRKDAWARPLRLFWPVWVLAPLFPVALNLPPDVFPRPGLPLLAGVTLGFLVMGWTYPFGLHIIGADRYGFDRGLGGDGFRRAWSVLPVRPEAVQRLVYLHGWLWGLAVAGVLGAEWVVSLARGRIESSGVIMSLPMLLVIPCMAGFLLARAAGDRRRGALSLICVILFIPLNVILDIGLHLGGVPGRDLQLGIRLAVLVVVVLLGALPPLVHLRAPVRAGGES